MATMATNPDDPRDPRLNDLNLRDEVTDEVPSELPEQMGGVGVPTLLPGTHIFRIPVDVADCLTPFDEVLLDPMTKQPIPDPSDPSKGRIVQRIRLTLDKDHPLVVVGGPEDGQMVTTKLSTTPRNRGKKGEAPIMVSDMAYLLRDSLQYQGALSKPVDWVQAIRSVAGRIFRAEHGLSAWCNPERQRYINDPTDPTHRASMLDPSGKKGCGGGPDKKRLYTSNFKIPPMNGQPGGWSDIAYCPFCQAKLRGFFQFERFLKPTPAMLAEPAAGQGGVGTDDDDVPF
jgi:hypothetical protein